MLGNSILNPGIIENIYFMYTQSQKVSFIALIN